MKTIALLFLCSISAFAQNVCVLTHGAAKSEEFKRGCPGEYPMCWKEIGKEEKLPDGFDPTWVVMTKEELDARFKSLDDAKEAWNKQQEEAPKLAEEQKKTQVEAAISEVEVGLKEWQSADEKAKGDVLLKLLQVIIDALRLLGADIKQVSIAK